MKTFLRHSILISISALLSWWLFLFQSHDASPRNPDPEPFVMALTPVLDNAPPSPVLEEPPAPEHEHEAAHEQDSAATGPPPPEAGTSSGSEDGEIAHEAADPTEHAEEMDGMEEIEELEESDSSAAAVMADQGLLAAAEKEISGESRKGFSSVFLASAEEQLKIGKFFGELIVLVPKAAINPDNPNPYYFRVSLDQESPQVEHVQGSPPLQQFRQYRDLFNYPYDQLPDVLRELRRSVLARNEVYLFGALIPPQEWALAMDRRRRVLDESGRDLSEVEQFVLRYVRSSDGSYDFHVEAIHFSDGTKINPAP